MQDEWDIEMNEEEEDEAEAFFDRVDSAAESQPAAGGGTSVQSILACELPFVICTVSTMTHTTSPL